MVIFGKKPFDLSLACMNDALANISTAHLKKLCIKYSDLQSARLLSLGSTLTAVAHLADIDALFSREQFSQLELDFEVPICMDDNAGASSDTLPFDPRLSSQ